MTEEEIFKIKGHIEIYARNEPRAKKITEILLKAVEELETKGWHDLRKNPEDLPEERHDVLCFVIHNEHRYYLQGYYNGGAWRCTPLGTFLNEEDVKAWCELLKFTEK